mgnify:CR=1 FL=1
MAQQLRILIRPDQHVCSEGCDIIVPKIYIHKLDGKEHIHWQFKPKEPWMTDQTLVRRVENIYVCKGTRSVHHCHAECTAPKITNCEHCLVCPISGLQWDNSTEEIKSWKLAAKCAPTLTVDKRDPNMFLRNVDGTLNNSSETLNVHVHQQTQEVKELLELMLFSFTRIRIELTKYVEGMRNANKALNKYKRECTHKKKPKNVSHMSVIYLHAKFRRPNFLRIMDRCKLHKGELFDRIANQVVGMHLCMTLHHKMVAPFRTFACACIYLMKYGLQHDEWIIPKEPAFASMLPEANVLGMFKIEKPLFTQTKNQILEAVRNLLSLHDPSTVKRMLTI